MYNSASNINQDINLKILHGICKCHEKLTAEKVWSTANGECDGLSLFQ